MGCGCVDCKLSWNCGWSWRLQLSLYVDLTDLVESLGRARYIRLANDIMWVDGRCSMGADGSRQVASAWQADVI